MMKNKILERSFEKIERCDICNSNQFEVFLVTPDRNYKTGTYTYVKCKRCDLIWLTPRPKKPYLDKFYPDVYRAYRPYAKTSSLQKFVRNLIRTNRLVAKILIRDELFFWEKKGKILDVGPGSGYYLHVLNGWGWDATGLELDKRAVRIAKDSGIEKIYQGDIYTAKFEKSSFDAVRYSLVLEHVPSATKELEAVKEILKKGGHVVLIVPNIDSLFFKLFKSFWYPLEPPRHFYQFTPKTISKLLKKLNYSHIRINYNQPPHPFLWSILYTLGLHDSDKKIGILAYPLFIIFQIINIFKKSDIIEVVAQKD